MNDESDSRMVRLPVRDMSDEPAPQRAAQEGDLPPLLTDEQIREVVRGMGFISLDPYKFARAIESEVRLALAAAGGGVPPGWKLVPVEPTAEMWAAVNKLDDEMAAGGYDGKGCTIEQAWECLLASSPQPEAAPAVAQVPSACAYPDCTGKEPSDGDCCKTPDMTQVPLEWRDWVEGVRDDILYPLAHRESDELSPIAEGLGQSIPNLLEMSAPEAPAQADESGCLACVTCGQPAQAAQSAGEVERGDVVAFEFYNRATGHAIVDYSVNTHVGNLSADKGYEARPLVYADKREEVTDGSKPIPLWQAREALDELEAAARGDAPFNHQAAAVVRAALSHKEPQR